MRHRGRWGRWLYLVDASHLQTRGFKDLDTGESTGFAQNDALLKFQLPLPASDGRSHNVQLRFGYADEDSNETYLGLTQEDFNSTPYRRYLASSQDRMTWKHTQVQGVHTWQPSQNQVLKTSVYRHDFRRIWYKVDGFRDSSQNLSSILDDPSGSKEIFYNILSGRTDSSSVGSSGGQLLLGRNDRVFYSQGVQTQWSLFSSKGKSQHEWDVTLRYHQDQINRNHTQDYKQVISRQIIDIGDNENPSRVDEDRARAWTLSVVDNWQWNSVLTLTPQVRAEVVEFRSVDFDSETERSDVVFAKGLGVLFSLSERLSTRYSVNEGVTVAGLDTSGNEAKEESLNYEWGLKFASPSHLVEAEVTYFLNDYKNITGTCSSSAGCSNDQVGRQFNGGQAQVQGLELRGAKGFQWKNWYFPVQLNATWIQAQFKNSFSSNSPEWGPTGAQVNVGDPLPYVPKYQYSALFGTEYKNWSQELSFIYQSKMYDQSAEADRKQIQAFGLIDWAMNYSLGENLKVFAKVNNVLAREYAASARPYGYRPGKPQSFHGGLQYVF